MSQQYTEVEWHDPAGGNPGTLINKARLDQMQTAHHYADGLEETDTVPTADPGVAYHKIVYCTADNTLYRWDGEAWTADIDDPTRELLEEHEADHDNPHQVTKSQVGLGNADNTSDMDKPISTATQTALNAKADKSDTYTKAQVDTALATKADKATTYTKTETDTLLGAKADKATTYTKTEVDTALATKADKATTLAGYGITDAYTKTEADTLLGAKANDDAVVHKAGTEEITGDKTFTARFAIAQSRNAWVHIQDNTRVLAEIPTTNLDDKIRFDDKTTAETASVLHKTYTDGDIVIRLTMKNRNGQEGFIGVAHTDTAGFFGQAPTPSANAPSNAIVNKSYLDGYLPMVRTTGNQIVGGIKTSTTYWQVASEYAKGESTRHASNILRVIDKNTSEVSRLIAYFNTDGSTEVGITYQDSNDQVQLEGLRYLAHRVGNETIAGAKTFTGQMLATGQRAYSAANTTDVATIGTLDAYTPMVRTTGNQDIAGNKTIKGIITTAMEGVWFSLTYATQHYSKICGISSTTTNFNFEIEIMGYDGKMILHVTKDGSSIRGFATWTDTLNNTPINPFVILNTTTGEYEVWGYRTIGRFYFYPKKLLFTNNSQNVDAMTKYGTITNTDPYGTPDYQTEGVNNPKINIPVRIVTGEIVNS